jgi:membrane dipeptidase
MRARLALAASLLVAAPALADDALETRARELHRGAIIVDTHVDAPDQLSEKYADLATRGATTHIDIPRARAGGLTAAFFSIYVSAGHADDGTAAGRALELIELTRRVVDEHPGDLVLTASAADIRAAKRAGKIAVLMGIEGGHAIEDSLGALRAFYRDGVRYMTLTHTNSNHWADSSGAFYLPDFDPKASRLHHGLTDHGREVVREMNRLGMIVDVSHVSDETVAAVLATSTAPVMASHSSCRALADMPRNLTDDQIRAIAKKGGVVMINFGSLFLDGELAAQFARDREAIKSEYLALQRTYAGDAAGKQKAQKALMERIPKRRTQWTRIVDHIDHVIQIAGPDAVGLGSDFDGVEDLPEGMDDVSMLPKLTAEMLRRGYSDEQVKKVLGENFLAFFARVEAAKGNARTP